MNFKFLSQIKGNSVTVFLLNIILSIRNGHCHYSLGAPKKPSYTTSRANLSASSHNIAYMIDIAMFTRQNSTQQTITKLGTLLCNVTAISGSQLCYCSHYMILILSYINSTLTVKFDVLKPVLLKIHAFWDLTSCCQTL